jgi:hypothetical protein
MKKTEGQKSRDTVILRNTVCTVKKAERDARPKHKCDGKVHHPRRMIGKIRQQHRLGPSVYVGDGIFRYPCVVVLRHAWLF